MALAHKKLAFRSVPTTFTRIRAVEDGQFVTLPIIRDGKRVVGDSFSIASYLDDKYADRPALLNGNSAVELCRFVESWAHATIAPFVSSVAIVDIFDCLVSADQIYFRTTREKRLGQRLEDAVVDRELRVAPFLTSLEPLRGLVTTQNFIGGEMPHFADYIVFGLFQWLRATCPLEVLPPEDPVTHWFDRCLDLHDGLGRKVPMANMRH